MILRVLYASFGLFHFSLQNFGEGAGRYCRSEKISRFLIMDFENPDAIPVTNDGQYAVVYVLLIAASMPVKAQN